MSLLNDPEVKQALQVLKDKGVQLYEIELWYGVAAYQVFQSKSKDEMGIFFCGNCGGTINKEMLYAEKPVDDCGNCGFNDWIFEPTGEEE